ncbi:hypothetical protein [Streptomyces mayteni]
MGATLKNAADREWIRKNMNAVIQLYRNGASLSELSRRYGVSFGFLKERFLERDEPLRNWQEAVNLYQGQGCE